MTGDANVIANTGRSEPRLTRGVLLTILGPALAYPIAGVDPLMLNLNLSKEQYQTGGTRLFVS